MDRRQRNELAITVLAETRAGRRCAEALVLPMQRWTTDAGCVCVKRVRQLDGRDDSDVTDPMA
jgi:hypothetical protein